MLFSSTVFMFVFLPFLLIVYGMVRNEIKQYVLVFFSLLFYAWGEPRHLAIMLLVCFFSYVFSVLIANRRSLICKRIILTLAICFDLSVLGYYKYANFFIENINAIFANQFIKLDVIMPIGISFFTFQALSYVIDVYREDVKVQYNLMKLILYISFFPQLIAGPIVKYHDVEKYLYNNESNFEDILYGSKRFIVGLGKKVLIANPLGVIADNIFNAGYQNADMGIAWLGAVTYSLQLFFDFSGYSDMAIGLGRIFGFHFLENFNYPYISKSITEFWRRWHISLGTWFKEYVYIPLGGNKKGSRRTYFNLFVVFLVTGVWHGANWTFILWGIWHGAFIIIERAMGMKNKDERSYIFFRHIYTMIAVVVGWTMFRADSVEQGVGFIKMMFGIGAADYVPFGIEYYLTSYNVFIIAMALILSTPLFMFLKDAIIDKLTELSDNTYIYGRVVNDLYLVLVLVLCISSLASSTYNPFIYFRF